MGNGANADNSTATALGQSASAAGLQSMALGLNAATTAAATDALAIGIDSSASGNYATAIGTSPTASGISSVAITTSGYFQVSADPSALRGTPMRVIRTNSMWSDSGLQLCTAGNIGDNNWCNDISDGYAGKLSEAPLARRAWSHGAMVAIFFLALAVTFFGWAPAAAVASAGGIGNSDDDESSSAT